MIVSRIDDIERTSINACHDMHNNLLPVSSRLTALKAMYTGCHINLSMITRTYIIIILTIS